MTDHGSATGVEQRRAAGEADHVTLGRCSSASLKAGAPLQSSDQPVAEPLLTATLIVP